MELCLFHWFCLSDGSPRRGLQRGLFTLLPGSARLHQSLAAPRFPAPSEGEGNEQGELKPCLGSAQGCLGGLSSFGSGLHLVPPRVPPWEHPQHPRAEDLSWTRAGISGSSL